MNPYDELEERRHAEKVAAIVASGIVGLVFSTIFVAFVASLVLICKGAFVWGFPLLFLVATIIFGYMFFSYIRR